MAQDWFSQNAPKTTAGSDWFAQNAPKAEPSTWEAVKAGAKEGFGDLKAQALSFIQHIARPGDIALQAAPMGQAAIETVKALADPATRGETARSLIPEPSVQGLTRLAVNLAPGAVMGGPKALRMAKAKVATAPASVAVETAGEAAARLQTAAPRLAKPTAARTIMDDIGDALTELQQEAVPDRVTLPPQAAQPLVSYPRIQAARRATSSAPGKAAESKPVKIKKAETATSELPASWKPFAKAEPETPTAPLGLSDDAPFWSRPAPTENVAGEMRRALGAEDAGALMGMSADDVRAAAGGPKRIPAVARLAELDRNYQRLINDPRGAVDPKLAIGLGLPVAGGLAGAAAASDGNEIPGGILGALAGLAAANPTKILPTIQTARVTGMLSGAALPKSVAGNVGAMLTAAAERGSTAPLKEALRVPTNLRNAAQGWTKGANPSGTGGMGALNIPGRAMGALDEMTTQALQRAGLTLEEAQRLLLTTPNPYGTGRLSEAMNSSLGRAVMPFQRTPANGWIEGINSLRQLAPGSGATATNRALTAGAGAAGLAAGSETDNPLLLALMAAFFGPRGIPFALGAGATAGPQVLERVGVGLPEGSVKDLLDPLKPINKPALLRLLETGGR